MKYGLNIRESPALDFLSLGALMHRLDPGIIPYRTAAECQIHVSGGEFNVAANLSDCFGLQTGIATAMVKNPVRSGCGTSTRHGSETVLQKVRAQWDKRAQYRHDLQ